ncbi:MAG: L-histidine N(alpha)-methyltransferase [Myxococcota bacterium]
MATLLNARAREAERKAFLADALRGLRQPEKSLPCKYFYDAEGSKLFDQICQLPEYYPTRTELGILREHAAEMAQCLGPETLLIEYGSGSSVKTRLLLDHLERPAAYVPVDVSREHLFETALALRIDYPDLPVLPLCADFAGSFTLPEPPRSVARRVVYFPGSTIGNLLEAAAVELMARVARRVGPGGAFVVGVDLKKDLDVLERAYDDAQGVTAAFNLNLLARMNQELGADFDLRAFEHAAVWNEEAGRIEMHLVSRIAQVARVDGEVVRFEAGERICTEHSHKYSVDGFARLAERAGLAVRRVWTDPRRYFSVQYLEVPEAD